MFIAAAALALTPAAAAAKKPDKGPQRAAKIERKAAKKHARGDSAQQRCRDERAALGPAEFAGKYGKARTKGSAKAKAKAARAAFGRCVSQTTKLIKAEREAAEEEAELAAGEEELEDDDAEGEDDDGFDDDASASDLSDDDEDDLADDDSADELD